MEEEAVAQEEEEEEESVVPSHEDEGDTTGGTAAAAAVVPPKPNTTTNPPPRRRPRIKPTPQMRKAVLEALSTGMHGGGGGDGGNNHTTAPAAPYGILKGRIRYYQRQGSRWRFEVDDVRLRRRPPLPKIRRRQERPSFWEVSREASLKVIPPAAKQQNNVMEVEPETTAPQVVDTTVGTTTTETNTTANFNVPKFSFELLAYDDIE
jgi:hypothetical protein